MKERRTYQPNKPLGYQPWYVRIPAGTLAMMIAAPLALIWCAFNATKESAEAWVHHLGSWLQECVDLTAAIIFGVEDET